MLADKNKVPLPGLYRTGQIYDLLSMIEFSVMKTVDIVYNDVVQAGI